MTDSNPPAEEDAEQPLLDVTEINTYYGLSHVLYDVSLSIRSGEIISLLGRNGVGKTTTLRSIMGLTPAKNGSVTFDNTSIRESEPYETRRAGISLVPEDRRIYPKLTVEQNLRVAANAGENDDFEYVYQQFPRLADRRTQQAGTMSGGEQQMLAIARALVGPDTQLLMLDEPSEGLAPKIVADVKEIISELNEQGITILLVEQNAEMALELSDRVYVLETGEVTYKGDAQAFANDRKLMEQHLGVK
jgi:branched-chain amino acid transport system ATP-binding protein